MSISSVKNKLTLGLLTIALGVISIELSKAEISVDRSGSSLSKQSMGSKLWDKYKNWKKGPDINLTKPFRGIVHYSKGIAEINLFVNHKSNPYWELKSLDLSTLKSENTLLGKGSLEIVTAQMDEKKVFIIRLTDGKQSKYSVPSVRLVIDYNGILNGLASVELEESTSGKFGQLGVKSLVLKRSKHDLTSVEKRSMVTKKQIAAEEVPKLEVLIEKSEKESSSNKSGSLNRETDFDISNDQPVGDLP